MQPNINNSLLVVDQKVGFSRKEINAIQKYTETVGPVPLPPALSAKVFEQFLGGMTMADIVKMHPEHDAGCILYTAYHYDWCKERDEYFQEIQSRLKQKAIVSTSQQLDLVTGLIHAAWAETMPALMSYIKHPCEKNLPKTLKIKSLKDLQIAISMMSTITGQGNNKSVTLNGEITVDNDYNRLTETTGTLTDDMVVQMLKSIVNKNIKLPE